MGIADCQHNVIGRLTPDGRLGGIIRLAPLIGLTVTEETEFVNPPNQKDGTAIEEVPADSETEVGKK